jgi:phage-related protein
MSSIISALSDLVTSMVELVWSFFTTAGHLVQNTLSFTARFATEVVELVINFFRGLVDLFGGIVSFLVGMYSPHLTGASTVLSNQGAGRKNARSVMLMI